MSDFSNYFVAKKYKSCGMHTRSSGDICRENATIVQEVTTRKLPAWRQLDNSVKRSKVLFFEKKIDLT